MLVVLGSSQASKGSWRRCSAPAAIGWGSAWRRAGLINLDWRTQRVAAAESAKGR
jgi:hypothetical protein